jgi:hypothetical protein
VLGIHWPQNVVGGNLAVKRVGQPLESGVTDGRINVLLFH